MNQFPCVSIVIPTLNSQRVLDLCLASIVAQDYPRENIEIIIVDAGSTDLTLEIARRYGVNKILFNPLKTGEAGKTVGIDASSYEIIGLIDSDNILEGPTWLQKMVAPLKNPEIFASEVLYWTYRRQDFFIDRYCALTGINDPICLFLGNYDRYSFLTNRWTQMPVKEIDRGDYLEVELTPGFVPTMGANGFLARKSVLQKVDYHPYYFDIDIVAQLTEQGYIKMARPKIGITHLFCSSVQKFRQKQRRRIYDYLYFKKNKKRSYEYNLNSIGFLKYLVYSVLVFPLIAQSVKGYLKKPDIAWFFHPLACWITLWEYGLGFICGVYKSKILNREGWSH